jgi:hypothetical protein
MENFSLSNPIVLWGVLAILLIVGLWYILLRKRAKPEEENPPKQ